MGAVWITRTFATVSFVSKGGNYELPVSYLAPRELVMDIL